MMPDGRVNPTRPEPRAKVRMCTRPGAVCLQGGCLYCPDGTWRMVKSLEAWAIKNGTYADFEYGWRNGWPNYPMKGSDS